MDTVLHGNHDTTGTWLNTEVTNTVHWLIAILEQWFPTHYTAGNTFKADIDNAWSLVWNNLNQAWIGFGDVSGILHQTDEYAWSLSAQYWTIPQVMVYHFRDEKQMPP